MIGSTLVILGAFVAQLQTTKPKVDRTGESAFREMLTLIASRTRFQGMILKSHRDGGREVFYPEGVIEMWRDGEKFRIEFNDMWGSSNLIVCDGKRVLEDSGMDPVVLKLPAKTWTATSSALDSKGAASSPWVLLMEGPALLERLDKDRSVTQDPATKSIVWDTAAFGKLKIRHVSQTKDLDVWEMQYDNMPWQQEMFKMAPEWFDPPDETAIYRQVVVITRGKFSRQTFYTEPGKGRAVDDQTKAAKKPPLIY